MTSTRLGDFPVREVFARLDAHAPWDGDWYEFQSHHQQEFLTQFCQHAPFPVVRQAIGSSVEGRALETIRFGRGKRRVLVWARQHGDESECTAALCVVLESIARTPDDPVHAAILDKLELLVFPVVNPDGMDHFTRQNAVGIDLNREAHHLAMPEARALVALKDQFQPSFSFNLHDMNPRRASESFEQPGLISLAFQAGPFDESNADNDVRLRAKTVIAHMTDIVADVIPRESLCRYKAYYMHRAFGDSMMRWGVPCVLIESGSWHAAEGGEDTVIRLHALALLAGLWAVATGADEPFNNDAYEAIPYDIATHDFNGLLTGARLFDPATRLVYRSDLGWYTELQVYRTDARRQFISRVEKNGDLSEETAVDRRRLQDGVLVPGMIVWAPGRIAAPQALTAESARPWLEAGFTTLVTDAGPFESDTDRDAWLHAALDTVAPMHIGVLERVSAPEVLLERNGLSEFLGLVAGDLAVTGGELLDFFAERREGSALAPSQRFGLEVALLGGASPRSTRMTLILSSRVSPNARDVGALDLRLIADSFLRAMTQVSIVWCDTEPEPPGLAAFGCAPGIPAGVAPPRDFLAQRLAAAEPSLAGATRALAAVTGNAARAFRLDARFGSLRPRSSADALLVPDAFADGITRDTPRHPALVVLNGRFVVDPNGYEETPRGTWQFAPL